MLTIGFLCSFTEREVNTLKLNMYIFWLIKAVLYSYWSFDHFNIHHKRGIHKQHISCKNWFLCYFLRRVYFLTRPSVIISNSVVQCCYRFRFMEKFGPFEFWLYIEFNIEQIVSAIPFKPLKDFGNLCRHLVHKVYKWMLPGNYECYMYQKFLCNYLFRTLGLLNFYFSHVFKIVLRRLQT